MTYNDVGNMVTLTFLNTCKYVEMNSTEQLIASDGYHTVSIESPKRIHLSGPFEYDVLQLDG